MKTVIGMSVLVVAGLVVTGLGFSGARDYSQVVVQRMINWAQTSPPLPVEIERLQLILGRLDSQLGDHQRMVAEASVDMERAERDVARLQESHGRVREKMVSLRDQLRENDACPVSSGGRQYPRSEATAALRSHVEAYKAGQRTLEAQETALQHLRTSHAKLAAKLDDWKLERDRVQNYLLELRSEYDA